MGDPGCSSTVVGLVVRPLLRLCLGGGARAVTSFMNVRYELRVLMSLRAKNRPTNLNVDLAAPHLKRLKALSLPSAPEQPIT